MEETRQLAEFVEQVSYNDLSHAVIDKAKDLILDQFGVQLASSTMPWSKAVYAYIKDKKGIIEESTIVNYGGKVMAEDAAFANATFGHGFEMDDTELVGRFHPGCVVVPPALAIGERERIGGKEFILAVVVGYDVGIRIGATMRLLAERGYHPTGVLGPFAAVATTSKILGFDKHQVLDALGIAGSEPSGIMEYTRTGGSVKRLHGGFASQKGIRAALLAQRGLTGPPTILEGERGFCQAYANEYFLEEITKDLGKEFRILWTGTKPYCCCAAQHAAIDGVSSIVKEHNVTPEEIQEIVVGAPNLTLQMVGAIVEPEDITGMQFSGAFGVALRLVKGGNWFKDYTEENLRDPQIRSMAKRVRFVFDEEMEKITKGHCPAKVTIQLKNGATYQERVEYAKGTVPNPMTSKELRDKFTELASVVMSHRQADHIVQTVKELESLNDIEKLASLLVA